MPRISVIMPVYNCELYVREAIDSILEQTYGDFELLIIDDASTDGTPVLVRSYTDQRIRFFEKPKNTGYTESLNMALKIARGEFIARMDGDDISYQNRFELQVKAFENNQDLVLCGSGIKMIDSGEVVTFPLTHNAIKVALLESCCIAHPTVMIKRSFLEKNQLQYDHSKEPAEDYDLWVRMIKHGAFKNLDEIILRYREHENQTSQKRRDIQKKSAESTRIMHLSSIVNRCAAVKFFSLENVLAKKNVSKELALLHWLEKENRYLLEKNRSALFFDQSMLSGFLQKHQKRNARFVFLHSNIYNLHKLNYFLKYHFKNPGCFSFTELLKTSVKCLLFYHIK